MSYPRDEPRVRRSCRNTSSASALRIDRINLLRIHVEEGELDVLQELGTEDWLKIHQLVIKVDQTENLNSVVTLLERHGYEVLVEDGSSLSESEPFYVYAIRPSAGYRLVRQQTSDAHLRSLPSADAQILTPAALRKNLKERLPQYMVPAGFVLMEKFLLNAVGKIDRKALLTYPSCISLKLCGWSTEKLSENIRLVRMPAMSSYFAPANNSLD
jgi:hypothetical protein